MSRIDLESPSPLREFSSELYRELRRVASRWLSTERADHTLQPTALVHETYLRLASYNQIDWEGRSHIVSIASRLMRQILSNHARARATAKRGGERRKLPLEETMSLGSAAENLAENLVELEDALSKLEELSPRLGRIVELRFFGGLPIPEVAMVLGVSKSTVERDWTMARAWLYHQLEGV